MRGRGGEGEREGERERGGESEGDSTMKFHFLPGLNPEF